MTEVFYWVQHQFLPAQTQTRVWTRLMTQFEAFESGKGREERWAQSIKAVVTVAAMESFPHINTKKDDDNNNNNTSSPSCWQPSVPFL